MGLTYYAIAQMAALGKAAIRELLTAVGTEPGADLAIIPDTAAQMFQGAQVAAAHIEEQLFPSTADAETIQERLELLGIDFTKEETKARGYVMLGNPSVNQFNKLIPKGTTIEFPGTAFVDGIARTFVTLEDGLFRAEVDNWSTETAGTGNSLTKIRSRTKSMRKGDLVTRLDSGTVGSGVVRRVDARACVAELFTPFEVAVVNGDGLTQDAHYLLVKVEAQEAGSDGNCASYVNVSPTALPSPVECSVTDMTNAWVVESSGGGDAVGEIDSDSARVIRVIEDTEAGVPSNGNPQHWREIALSNPHVDLDDAVVYSGVRGPGSIDIVCIGRSGQMRSSAFPSANVGHLAHGHNRRRIGEVQAALVEQWCNFLPDGTRRANYFDDVKCHSVEWDYRGPAPSHYSDAEFLRSVNGLFVTASVHAGYGPDAGKFVEYTLPHTNSLTRLYPSTVGADIDDAFAVGQRVGVTFMSAAAPVLYPFATIITPIIGIDHNRKFVTVADMTPVASLMMSRYSDAQVFSWRTAGPLDQQIEDACFAYFDSLGPGSYTTTPFDHGYQDQQSITMRHTPPGIRLERWPDEGRRWSGSFRASALRARLNAIKGVHSITLRNASDDPVVDFDPSPMQTLAPCGVSVAAKAVGS